MEKANSAQDALDDAEYTGGLLELYDNTMFLIKNNTKKGWRNPSLTQVEISEMMDRSRGTVQMLMKELLDEGVIERIGSKKTGSWIVKKI